MTLYLSPETASAFNRVAVAWKSGRRDCELVLERRRGGRLHLSVSMGAHHADHELDLHPNGLQAISAASKLIKIEETSPSLPESPRTLPRPAAKKPQPAPVKQHSKLITIEDTRGRQLVKIALPVTSVT
jgi:hypothetical protein